MKTHDEIQSPALARVFENLENGNLDDARRGAKRFTEFRLAMFARRFLFWPMVKSLAAAQYLKGEGSFQEYCDSK